MARGSGRRGSGSRRRSGPSSPGARLAGPAALVVLAIVVAGVVVGAHLLTGRSLHAAGTATTAPSSQQSVTIPSGQPDPVTSVNPALAPVPPAKGAYFGAWVGPPIFSQVASIDAVDSLQQQIGRRLDIVHTYQKWGVPFPSTSQLAFIQQGSTLLLSWAGTTTTAIYSGSYDSLIRSEARAVKAVRKPVFLEWRWEMERPNLAAQVGTGADYVAAWRHIRAIFAKEHVHNAAWVWCPSGRAFQNSKINAYYPGNNEVDWICADIYPRGPQTSFAVMAQPFLQWASHRPKPVMIGEFGDPQSYGSGRAQWLLDAAKTIKSDPQIKAVLYFDADPTGNGPAYAYSLQDGTSTFKAFRKIADEPYFNPQHLPVSGS